MGGDIREIQLGSERELLTVLHIHTLYTIINHNQSISHN